MDLFNFNPVIEIGKGIDKHTYIYINRYDGNSKCTICMGWKQTKRVRHEREREEKIERKSP